MAPTTTGCRTRCYVGATRVVEETDDCDSHGNRVHARTMYQKRTREHDDRLQLRDCGRGDRVKSEKLLRVLSSIYVHTLSRRPYARARLRPRVLVRGRVPRAFRTERIFSLRRAHARQLLSRCILNNVAAAAYCLARTNATTGGRSSRLPRGVRNDRVHVFTCIRYCLARWVRTRIRNPFMYVIIIIIAADNTELYSLFSNNARDQSFIVTFFIIFLFYRKNISPYPRRSISVGNRYTCTQRFWFFFLIFVSVDNRRKRKYYK